MKAIWKWPLDGSKCALMMPKGALVLDVQNQKGQTQMWALVDPNAERVPFEVRLYMTGERLPNDPGKHLGTVQLDQGEYIIHVFEVPK